MSNKLQKHTVKKCLGFGLNQDKTHQLKHITSVHWKHPRPNNQSNYTDNNQEHHGRPPKSVPHLFCRMTLEAHLTALCIIYDAGLLRYQDDKFSHVRIWLDKMEESICEEKKGTSDLLPDSEQVVRDLNLYINNGWASSLSDVLLSALYFCTVQHRLHHYKFNIFL